MLQSVWEYIRSVCKAWWAVVAFVVAIVSAVLLLLPIQFVPSWIPWILVGVMVIGLLVAPFGAFHRVRLERDRLKERSEAKPAIEVVPVAEPIADGNEYYLEVRNVGQGAEFTAQIQILDSNVQIPAGLKLYRGWWQQAHRREVNLNRHGFDLLKIARIETRGKPGAVEVKLHLNFYDPNLNTTNWRYSTGWLPKAGNQALKPECTLRVDITSNPSLKQPFSKRYRLTLDGLTQLEPG